jgi:O-antigen/teichoic acid export membrane protein
LKKDSFLKGAFMSMFFIIVGKIIGILYIVPLHKTIGEEKGALYAHAYSNYEIFTTLSWAISLAVSKIVSEYDTLKFLKTKARVYKLAKIMVVTVSLFCSVGLFMFASVISKIILGQSKNTANSVDDITFVLRIVSLSLVFVGILGCTRGYLQGNKYISIASASQVFEQLIRVVFILVVGCYLVPKVLKLDKTSSVSAMVFSATIAAIVTYIYLKYKIRKDKISRKINYEISNEEKNITNKLIIKRIIFTALPFAIVGISDSAYAIVNSWTVVKTLNTNCGYSGKDADIIYSVISVYSQKLNAIVGAVALGLIQSLLPNLAGDLVKSNLDELKKKINKTLQLLFLLTIPMAAGLSFLAEPVWTLFFSSDKNFGSKIFAFGVFTTIFSSVEVNVGMMSQALNRFKTACIASFCGLLTNAILNVPLMIWFNKIGLKAYNAPNTATMLGLLVSITVNLVFLKRAYKISFKPAFKQLLISIFATLVMIVSLNLFKHVISVYNGGLLKSLMTVFIFSLIGSVVYITVVVKVSSTDDVLEKHAIKNFISKICLRFQSKNR